MLTISGVFTIFAIITLIISVVTALDIILRRPLEEEYPFYAIHKVYLFFALTIVLALFAIIFKHHDHHHLELY